MHCLSWSSHSKLTYPVKNIVMVGRCKFLVNGPFLRGYVNFWSNKNDHLTSCHRRLDGV